jgi:N utilization substance protein A
MTPEQLEEVPGIGEKTVEKISVAVRHYFGQYEEGEDRPEPAAAPAAEPEEVSSLEKTPEAILAEEAGTGRAREINEVSAEDIARVEDEASTIDAYSDADEREARIELNNDAVDTLVDETQEHSDEGVDDGNDRG